LEIEHNLHTYPQTIKFGLGSGTVDSKVTNDAYYTGEAKYDLVPVVYQNLDSTDIDTYEWFNSSPEQSSQLRGQFINSRFTNLSNDFDFYITNDIDTADETGYNIYEYGLSYNFSGISLLSDGSGDKDYSSATLTEYDTTGTNDQIDFIWNGSYATGEPLLTTLSTVGNTTYNNGILMHIDHPEIDGKTALDIQSNGFVGLPKTTPRRADDSYGRQQTAFKLTGVINNEGNAGWRSALKNSFEPNDQYLLGGHSCGSFLYVAPLDKESLVVDADNKSGKISIPGGNANAITVDLIFQYRMTDYYGVGSSGTGRIGGVVGSTFTNLTYAKRIGFDILDSQNNDFKFDIEVYSKYRPLGKNINSINASLLSNYNTFASGGGGIGSINPRTAFLSENIDFEQPEIYFR